MRGATEVRCDICGEPKHDSEGWFILMENQWTDRLKILAWKDGLALATGVHTACGAAHVQQLVVHWMAMGTLDYPFAVAPTQTRGQKPRRDTRTGSTASEPPGCQLVGELAVHRESLARVLRESPESLAGILEALVSAITNNRRPPRSEESIEEEADLYAFSEA